MFVFETKTRSEALPNWLSTRYIVKFGLLSAGIKDLCHYAQPVTVISSKAVEEQQRLTKISYLCDRPIDMQV